MKKEIVKARMFPKSQYGFNYYCLQDFNYSETKVEKIVVKNGISCFELNSMCSILEKRFQKYNIEIYYYKNENGNIIFYSKDMQDITVSVPSQLINELKIPSQNTIYRHRYIIDENMVVVRNSDLGVNNNTKLSVANDEIFSKEIFLERYGILPCQSFAFCDIEI